MAAKIQRESLPIRGPKNVRPGTYALADKVPFASASAETAADEMGLTSAQFEGQEASSPNGFTVADVKRIAGA